MVCCSLSRAIHSLPHSIIPGRRRVALAARRLLATRTSSVYRGVTAPALHSQHHRHLSSPLPPQSKPRRGGAASVVRRVTSSASSRSA